MKLKFLGATGTVTGSKYLLSIDNQKFLVDCGLFQGKKELRSRNWDPLPIAPHDIDAVILTHAHIDHSGYIPLLVKRGFSGPIYATKGTIDLCEILLPDSGYLQEEEAKRANRYGYSKHHPALPLYTQEEAKTALQQFYPVEFGKPLPLNDEAQVTWYRAGHILGSAIVQFQINQTKLVFTGDLGRQNDPLMRPPAIIQAADYLVTESTYGNRLHEETVPQEQIADLVNKTIKRGGTLVIPAFAVGRAQLLLYYLYLLKQTQKIPDGLPVYLDSPMAINATKLLHQHYQDHKLQPELCVAVCQTAQYINTPEESKDIMLNPDPKIIISASGMATGGRVLHHLKTYLPDERHSVLLAGFQAAETRGAKLLHACETIKIHGEQISVKATIENLSNVSAHADYRELLTWFRNFNHPPGKTFITHGEPDAAESLKKRIEAELNWPCEIPQHLQEEEL